MCNTPRMVGRPTLYDPKMDEQARKLCLLGATDDDLASFFGVVRQTIENWKEAHPQFLDAIRAGKEEADANVASRLYERAMGYSHPEVHVSNFQGDVTLTPLTKHYPPDTNAASLWLRNRQPKRWRDKVDTTQQQLDKDGNPIDPVLPMVTVTISRE